MHCEDIVLIPPTHEISTPSFHVPRTLCASLIARLEANGLSIAEEPRPVGVESDSLIEVRVKAGSPMDRLEELLTMFRKEAASALADS
jgi:hypothetical protein